MKFPAYLLGISLVLGFLFVSCERGDDEPNDPSRFAIDTTRTYVDDSYENRLKDSVWYYYKYLSLWEQYVNPSTALIDQMDSTDFLKNNYTKYFQSAGDVLGYLMYTTKANVVGKSVKSNKGSGNYFYFYKDILYNHTPGESKAYDWYSFLDRGGFVTGAIQQSNISGFGMDLIYLTSSSNTNKNGLYVRFVEKNSSAYRSGLRRGDKITSLNGNDQLDYETNKKDNFVKITNYLSSSSLDVRVMTPTNEVKNVRLDYLYNRNVDPIFIDTVLQVASKKVAYMGLSSFASIDSWIVDGDRSKSFRTRIDEVFSKFSSQSVSNIIIDLRYNGGGAVLTSEYLADCLVPPSNTGKLMYTNKINPTLKSFGWDKDGDIFGPVNYSKKGSLNVSNIYFLVSEETASASEMLINVLSPYAKVYIIGTYKKEGNVTKAMNTYGKPVGFFPVDIVSSSNELYVISFQMFNKDGFGDYFDGLVPNSHVWESDSFLDFGNQNESMLSNALEHIKTGSFKTTQARSVKGESHFEQKIQSQDLRARRIFGMYKFPNAPIKFK